MKFILPILLSLFILNHSVAQDGNEMIELGHWSSMKLDTQMAYIHYNEVWGIAVNEHEYAIIGGFDGTHIIDVTDPENPEEVFFVEGAYNNTGVIHRDYHDYDGYLYAVCDEGPSTLQIMDLHYLPDSLPLVYDSPKLLVTSHNIFVDTAAARLYHVGGSSDGAVTIYDLTEPTNPVELGHYNMFAGQTINYAHDAHVRGDTAYLNCGPDGLAIVDFSNTDTINTISLLGTDEYPQSGYNHSGWLTDDGKTYIMADETNGKDVKVFNVGQLPEIELLTTINPGNQGNHIPHNPIVKGDYVYISYYKNGIQVWDISSPATPVKTNYFIPSDNPDTWGVYPYLPSGNILMSDVNTGLYILKGIDTTTVSTVQAKEILDIELSPNPVTDYVQIKMHNNHAAGIITIYNTMGQQVYRFNFGKNQEKLIISDLAHWSTGIYHVHIHTIDGEYKGSFVK